LGSVWQSAFPVTLTPALTHRTGERGDKSVANERAFVLAEEISIRSRNQLFLHLVDKDVRSDKADVRTVSRNALVRPALDARKRKVPTETERSVAPAALVAKAQAGLVSAHA